MPTCERWFNPGREVGRRVDLGAGHLCWCTAATNKPQRVRLDLDGRLRSGDARSCQGPRHHDNSKPGRRRLRDAGSSG
jgi:hypothetical protein